MKIPPEDFRWHAAFHDEGNHPHVHMMAWSVKTNQAYMKALYHRFETPSRRAEYLDRKIKRTHNQLTRLLDKPGRKLLLRIADLEDELRDEACLNSFISGYRLAQGIQQELLADQPPYSFEAEDERQACESWERRDTE